jgi:hypothetical protein
MKPYRHPARHVPALLIGAAAFLSIPAFAQDAPVQQDAPPAAQTTPDVAPPPVVPTMQNAEAPVVTMAPEAPVVQPVPEAAVAPTPQAPVERTATQTRATRTVTRTASATPSARATPRPETSPSASTPPEGPTIGALSPAPASDAAPPVSQTTAQSSMSGLPTLAWGLGIAMVLVALGLLWFAMRRRNGADAADVDRAYADRGPRTVYEPVMTEPAAAATMPLVAEPVAPNRQKEIVFEREPDVAQELNGSAAHVVQPHAADSATVHEANADDLSGITDAPAPVKRRPWLELGMRPLRAGTSHKEAMVEVELIVGNAGDTPAEDVRISTFMLPAGSDTEMDRLLTEQPEGTKVETVDIAPGEGACVDAIMSVPRAELNGDPSFAPLVVAEARYKLPDGSEGRTAAAFKVGVTDADGDRFDPIALDRAEIFHTVAAQLHGTPEHV